MLLELKVMPAQHGDFWQLSHLYKEGNPRESHRQAMAWGDVNFYPWASVARQVGLLCSALFDECFDSIENGRDGEI